MTPTEPQPREGMRAIVFAKDQPQYIPLPALYDQTGLVITEWEPTAEELDKLLCGGRVRLYVHTFRQPLQPVSLEVAEPECGYDHDHARGLVK